MEDSGTQHSSHRNNVSVQQTQDAFILFCYCSATCKRLFVICVIIYAPTTSIWTWDALVPEAAPIT